MKKLKLGMIGCGWIRPAHMSGLNDEVPEIEVAAACDVFPESVQRFCERHDIKDSYTDPIEMMDKAGLDAVSIAIKPEWDKVKLTIEALNRGLNVLAEKPMALTVKEAEAMAEAARKSGKVLQIGFNRRFEPIYSRAKEIVSDSALFGDVATLNTTFTNASPAPYVCFMSQNPHTFDLMQYLGGRVTSIRSITKKLFDQDAVDKALEGMHSSEIEYGNTEPGLHKIDVASTLTFESGAIGTFNLTTHTPGGRLGVDRFEIYGTNNAAIQIENQDVMTVIKADGTEEPVNTFNWSRKISSFGLEYRHFVEWIETGKPTALSLEDALASVYLYEGFIRSLKTTETIDLINWKE